VISGEALRQPDWALGTEIATLVMLMVFFGLLAVYLAPGPTVAIGVLILGGLFAVSFYAFAQHGGC